MEWLLSVDVWAAFLTLTALEIVLGIDNIIFISVLTNRLPEHQRTRGRLIGLSLAMIMRILLLLSLSWIMTLQTPLFEVLDRDVSGRDLILFGGGVFLIWKAVLEVHNSLVVIHSNEISLVPATMMSILFQIAVIDIVFSLDSVITAVGLVEQVPVMVAAIVCAVLVMMVAANPISKFVEANPPIKMLALTFLVLIGFTLVADAWGMHVPKQYIYFAMAFALIVELLNVMVTKRELVKLRKATWADLMQE